MNQCLRIAEVQEQVVQHLTARDGVSFVLACKSFYESGMDCAWKSVSSFNSFIHCMPQHLRVEESCVTPTTNSMLKDVVYKGDLVIVGFLTMSFP